MDSLQPTAERLRFFILARALRVWRDVFRFLLHAMINNLLARF